MLKSYKFGFDIWALLLFVLVMVPNIVWFSFPAPVDVLRVDSVTETLDAVASVLQVMMIAALCLLKRRDAETVHLSPLIILAIACVLLYYVCWVAYYFGVVLAPVLLGLAAFPCAAFISYAADRRNWIALVLACAFSVCHLVFAIANFIV